MTIARYVVAALLAIAVLLVISDVGKPRAPLSGRTAVGVTVPK